eukprot:COSAG02_NODE_42694_length_382_cov_0.727915_1_plen_110_part_10
MGLLPWGRISSCRSTASRAAPGLYSTRQKAIRTLSFLVDPTCTLPSREVPDVTETVLEVAGKTLHVRGAPDASHRLNPEIPGKLPWTGGFIWDSAPLLANYVSCMSLEAA